MADSEGTPSVVEPAAEHTEVRVLLLADRAEVSQGKLYIMGGAFETFIAMTVPTPIQFGVALVMAVPWTETNEAHKVALDIEDGDGHRLAQLALDFTTGRPPELAPGEEQRVPFAIPQITLHIQTFGLYVVKASVDGRPGPRAIFRVRQGGAPGVAYQQPR